MIEKKNVVQILSSFLCTVKDQQLILSATNMDLGIKLTLSAAQGIVREGQTTLPAKKLFEIVRELPQEPITLQLKENHWLEMTCARSRFRIAGMAPDQYPGLPSFPVPSFQKINKEALRQMIHQTIFAVSSDPMRGPICGVYFNTTKGRQPGRTRFVAMDGHRLVLTEHQVFSFPIEPQKSILLFPRTLVELEKILAQVSPEQDEISWVVERGFLFVEIGHCSFFARLMEGDYPEYEAALPRYRTTPIILTREALQSALTRVALLTHEKTKAVRFHWEKQALLLTSTSDTETGEASETVELNTSVDQMPDVAFNAAYLVEALAVMQTEEVAFYLEEGVPSAMLTEWEDSSSEASERSSLFEYVVMPMRP